MSLEIKEVKITDSMGERAKTCTLTLAPPDSDRQNRSVAEVRHPGDTQSIVATNIRPNNKLINIMAAFGGLPTHTIFAGVVEDMDDLEDPDQNIFNIQLSASPVNQAHRHKVNVLHNSTVPRSMSSSIRTVFDRPGLGVVPSNRVTVTRPSGLDHFSSNNLLQLVCQKAGIKLGRNDLPPHTLWGSYEVIRKNPMEVAEELCAPFNTFDFQKYFVRCDETNGLQIIKVDYTKGAGVSNPYVVGNLERKTRSFARYMPENRIGDSDVVCRGAEIYGPESELSSQANVVNKKGDPNAFERPGKTMRRIAGHTYTNRDENDKSNPFASEDDPSQDLGDTKTETETKVAFVCTITTRPEIEDGDTTYYDNDTGESTFSDNPNATGYDNPWNDPSNEDNYGGGDESLSLITNPPRDIDDLISELASGAIMNLSLNGQYVLSSKTTVKTKTAIGESISEIVSNYSYSVTRFPKHIYKNASDSDVVLVYDETITSVSCEEQGGKIIPRTLVKHWYKYSSFGVQASVKEATYMYTPRETWALVDIQVHFPDSSAATSAEIAYYADQNSEEMKERKKRWQEAYEEAKARGYDDAAAKEYANGIVPITATTQGIISTSTAGFGNSAEDNRVPIGRYTLLNGKPYNVSANGTMISKSLSVVDTSRPSINNAGFGVSVIQRQIGPESQYDPEQRLKGAFEISVPYMDNSGLMLLWNLAVRQKELEKNNAYWEIVKGTCPIDTTPVAGASVVVHGSGGIAETVTHVINEDDAITTVELRRLVW